MATLVTVMQHILTAIVITPTLAACSLFPPRIDPPVVPIPEEKKTVEIDPFLLKPCPQHLALPGKGTYTELGSLEIVRIWDGQLFDCAKRQSAVVEIMRKAFNINEIPPPDPVPVITPNTVNK